MTNKNFNELNLNNAFLFSAAMSDPTICRLILSIILGQEMPEVKVHTEHSILFNTNYKSVRLDVFASDAAFVDYDVEMQSENEGNLAKRSRFYHAEMDIASLKPGEDYHNLQPSYVIFICTFDPFGQGLYQYVFENRCRETDKPLGDGTTKIFLNTKGKNARDVPKLLVDFLHYVEQTTGECAKATQNTKINELHARISLLKENREWRNRHMTVEEYANILAKKARAEGHAEGHAEGFIMAQNAMTRLICLMSEHNESHLLPRLSDQDFLQEMLAKYRLNI